jgi:YD repeat-containing protein
MDEDLNSLTRGQLLAEVQRLRQAIRVHRDSSGHALCWHHPDLWNLLPDKLEPAVLVPAWPQFMQGCVRYRQSLDEQAADAPRCDAPYPAGTGSNR